METSAREGLTAVTSLLGQTEEEAAIGHLLDRIMELVPADRAEVVFTEPQSRVAKFAARLKEGSPTDPTMLALRARARHLVPPETLQSVLPARPPPEPPDPAWPSLIAAPLICRQDSFGLVWAASGQPGAFSGDAEAVLGALASAAAAAEQVIRLDAEVSRQAATLTSLAPYLPKQLIRDVTSREATLRMEGEQREITVLFADLRGFTAASERMDATGVVSMLNAFFTRMVAVIQRNDGLLDKFIGDALMAIWGVPICRGEDPMLAVNAATGMLEELEELNAKNVAQGQAPIAMGVGIHTGLAAFGNIGSSTRKDWTAVGATVNLASRIEGTTGPGDIHVSDATFQRVRHAFRGEPLAPVRLKNVANPVQLYRIIL